MTQEKKSELSNKKTLSINSDRLGLPGGDIARNFSVKTDVSYSRVQTRKSSNNTVMIVTKNKNNRPTFGASSGKSNTSLTEKEKEERINALISAERERRSNAVSVNETVENTDQDTNQTTEALQNAQEEDVAVSGSDDLPQDSAADVVASADSDVAAVISDEKPELASESVHNVAPAETFDAERGKKIQLMLNTKGKVRNLNHINKDIPEKSSNTVLDIKQSLKSGKAKEEQKTLTHKKVPVISDRENTPPSTKPGAVVKRAAKRFSGANLRRIEQRDDDNDGIVTRYRKSRHKSQKQQKHFTADKITREVLIPDAITVQELSNRMAEKASDLIKTLMKLGMMVTINQAVDADTAELLVSEFGHTPKRVTDFELEKAMFTDSLDDESDLTTRAPIVTIMGHVDHGKTSLLDALRCTDVVRGESGGITQHIGAYYVSLESGHSITFLDTPGHKAFTAMRMRGAKVTDIVVLVVAADDGIKEQTIEAINHAKAAKVPIIVAINKIDKPDSNIANLKASLLAHGLVPEEMGGDTMVVEVSAKNKIGLEKLEETILLQSELLSLKASVNRSAGGAVIEAKMDKNRGAVATFLVLKGTLKIGNMVVVGTSYGKIRALVNDKGEHIASATPSIPVEVLGLNQVPSAGDEFIVVSDERQARALVDFRLNREKTKKIVATHSASLDQLFHKVQQSNIEELALIVKADVNGSIEAIVSSFMKFSNDEVKIKVMHSGVGAINESDVTLAATSNALVLGFNVRANNQAKNLAKQFKVDIRYYSVIYDLVDDVKAAVSGMLAPTIKEKLLGYVEVRQVFDLTKVGKVAGGYVTEGLIQRNASVRLIRDNIVIHEGTLKTLKRFKDDVKEVKSGFECGLALERYDDIKNGDRLEVFLVTHEGRSL